MSYLLHLTALVSIYGLLALSLEVSVGLTALVSVLHAALFGVGAYTAAHLLLAGHDAPAVLLAAALAALCAGVGVAFLLRRIGGDYFAVATFVLQAAALEAFVNLETFTGGASGLAGFGGLEVLGFPFSSSGWTVAVSLVFIAVLAALRATLGRAPFGRVCAALREDEAAVTMLGHDPSRLRLATFGVGAAFAGIAGALYAGYVGFLSPVSFGVEPAIAILACVILGGAAGTVGPVIGAAVYITLPEALRFLGLPSGAAANLQAIFFGAALVLAMIWVPRGTSTRFVRRP